MTVVSKLLSGTTALVATLSQSRTNGNSKWGTLQAPNWPHFMTNNPMVNGYPWGPKSVSNSDPYYEAPDTGVIRSYDFTIARGVVAPDGYSKSLLLVNGQYPGPPIEANWGDTIQVTVNNGITNPEEGTSLHWHGFLQQKTEWEDGTPSVSMCPIPPASSYTYTFKATPYGSSWYHSHYSSQYADGTWGPMIIHGPSNLDYDIDLGPVTLNDYYHRDNFDILKDVVGTDLSKVRVVSDNNLINGKMNFQCPDSTSNTTTGQCVNNAGLAKFNFVSGKKHRLRLINTGIAGIQKFSIDNHNITIFANDFIPIKPYSTNVVTLGVGQRSDVVVEATGQSSDVVWMRSMLSSGECTEPSNQPLALATVYYEKANTTASPGNNSVAHIDTSSPCENDDLAITTPEYPISVGNPDSTINLAVGVAVNATGHLVWTINDSAYRGNFNNPILLLAQTGNTSYPMDPEWNVYNTGANKTIRVIVQNDSPTSHPWHYHGHEIQILASGSGSWDGTVVNPSNPNRRDTHLLVAGGYLVLQWESDNPGVWPMHCHIAWHISGGLNANFLERPDDIKNLKIPSTSFQNCRNWATYSGGTVVNQIDAGL